LPIIDRIRTSVQVKSKGAARKRGGRRLGNDRRRSNVPRTRNKSEITCGNSRGQKAILFRIALSQVGRDTGNPTSRRPMPIRAEQTHRAIDQTKPPIGLVCFCGGMIGSGWRVRTPQRVPLGPASSAEQSHRGCHGFGISDPMRREPSDHRTGSEIPNPWHRSRTLVWRKPGRETFRASQSVEPRRQNEAKSAVEGVSTERSQFGPARTVIRPTKQSHRSGSGRFARLCVETGPIRGDVDDGL
jgi:hypothetical protein